MRYSQDPGQRLTVAPLHFASKQSYGVTLQQASFPPVLVEVLKLACHFVCYPIGGKMRLLLMFGSLPQSQLLVLQCENVFFGLPGIQWSLGVGVG